MTGDETEVKTNIARWLLDPDKQKELPFDLQTLEKEIRESGLEKIYREIELPLIPILRQMHDNGIGIDIDYLKKLETNLFRENQIIVDDIYGLAGGEFNLNSPKQLSSLLFEKLKIKKTGLKRIKSGQYSTDADSLKTISKENRIIPRILKYRELFKVLSTYVKPLIRAVSEDGRIHSNFLQTGTATGRLSSQNPNLQNIPVSGEWGEKLRNAFVAEKSFSFLAFDYSQIELRVLASVAEDPKMIRAFEKNIDIHLLTAAQVFNIPVEKVTPEMRRIAKTLNFGVIYGMGPDAFAKESGLSGEEAENFIAEYFSDFAEVKRWHEEAIKTTRALGYAENLNGRRRYLPLINDQKGFLRALSERAAINMPIQSLAADILKLSTIKIFQEIEKNKKLKDGVRLVLSIHDELLFEIRDDILKEADGLIRVLMEKIYPLKVPLKVEVKLGKTWGRMEKMEL